MTRTGRVLPAAEAEGAKTGELRKGGPCSAQPAVSAVPCAKRLAARKKGVWPGDARVPTRAAWKPLNEVENTDVGPRTYREGPKRKKREFLL
jgi:hypothetical protein